MYFFKSSTDIDKMPSVFWGVVQVTVMCIIEDFGFYWGHRMCHHPILYKHCHKWHHEEKEVTSFSAGDADFSEFVLTNLVGSMLAVMIFGPYTHVAVLTVLYIVLSYDG